MITTKINISYSKTRRYVKNCNWSWRNWRHQKLPRPDQLFSFRAQFTFCQHTCSSNWSSKFSDSCVNPWLHCLTQRFKGKPVKPDTSQHDVSHTSGKMLYQCYLYVTNKAMWVNLDNWMGQNDVTLSLACISKRMHSKMWDGSTNPFPSFHGFNIDVS